MPEKMQFTKARIAALEPVPGKRITVYDEAQKGLCIRVTPAGAKAFYCVRRVEGKVEWVRPRTSTCGLAEMSAKGRALSLVLQGIRP